MGINFGKRSYVPGSSNRVAALLGGQANATIIDMSNKNKLMRGPAAGDFNVLEMFDVDASDEALFGNLDWIQENADDVQIFVNALLSVYKDMAADPTMIRRETDPDGPIGQLPAEILDELDGFYADAVAGGLYSVDGGGICQTSCPLISCGGGRTAAMADMEWYSAAGQLGGRCLDPEDRRFLVPRPA